MWRWIDHWIRCWLNDAFTQWKEREEDTDNEQMTGREADLFRADRDRQRTHSVVWSRVKRGKLSVWVGEDSMKVACTSHNCQFTSQPFSSPLVLFNSQADFDTIRVSRVALPLSRHIQWLQIFPSDTLPHIWATVKCETQNYLEYIIYNTPITHTTIIVQCLTLR